LARPLTLASCLTTLSTLRTLDPSPPLRDTPSSPPPRSSDLRSESSTMAHHRSPSRASHSTLWPWIGLSPRTSPSSGWSPSAVPTDRKSTRLNSSHEWTSYAVFCVSKKQAGKAFTGTQGAGGPDSIGVSYRTYGGDGVIQCDGSNNLGPSGMSLAYNNLFTVVPAQS